MVRQNLSLSVGVYKIKTFFFLWQPMVAINVDVKDNLLNGEINYIV